MNNFDFTEYRLIFNHSINLAMTMSVEQYPVLHSDWLYRVFESAWRRLFDEELPLDKLRISSGFPYNKDDSQVINFVKSENEFYPLSLQGLINNQLKQGIPSWRFQLRKRASFSRKNQRREQRFVSTEIYFKENSGIWLGARFTDAETKNKFDAALRFLGDEGIGGAKSAGYGSFIVSKINEIKFNCASDFSLLSLSRFTLDKPSSELFKEIRPSKQLVKTEIDSQIQTKEILFFNEGTLLNNIENFDYFNAGEIITEKVAERSRKHVGFLFAIPVSNTLYE